MAQSAQSETAVTVGDVVVTAQRREQSLQDVPIAITAFNAEALERINKVTVKDVQRLAKQIFRWNEMRLAVIGKISKTEVLALIP